MTSETSSNLLVEQSTADFLHFHKEDIPPRTTSILPSTRRRKSMSDDHGIEDCGNLDLSYYFNDVPPRTSITLLSNNDTKSIKKRGRSLSTGSTMSIIINQYQNEIEPIVIKNKRESYDIKQFTEPIQLDVSLNEVKNEGLKALLYSTIPLAYFLYFLLNEYSSENLFFYLEVESYQQNSHASYFERTQVANDIIKTYLSSNSDLEINLEDKVYRQIQDTIRNQNNFDIITGKEFDAAKKHIFSLLNVSYLNFRTSSLWETLESKCNSLNRNSLQSSTVNLLLSFIKDNNTTLSKLVHNFCKIYLPIGYQSYNTKLSRKSFNSKRNRSKSMGNESKKFTSKFDIFKLSSKKNNKALY